MNPLQPLAGFEIDDALGWRNGEPLSAGRFCSAAIELAARLPRSSQILNLCDDRMNFALGLVAALMAGKTTLLPSSRAAGVVRDLVANNPESCCLADHDELPAGLPALMMPSWPHGAVAPHAMPAIPGDLAAVVLFTSGSTGRPRPHVKSWRSLASAARALAGRLRIASGCAILGTVPPQHMYGLETTIMLPLQSGMGMHPARPLLPADIAAALAEMPPTRWLAATPLHLRACVADTAEFPPLCAVLSATMPLPPDLAQAVEMRLRAPLHEIYGCTEAGVVGLRRTAQEERWHAGEGLSIRQESGATWISGDHLDGAIELPDRLQVLRGDEFALLGRPEDMLKIAGKRASLEALNAELLRIPGVRDGVFFVPESAAGERRLAALVAAPTLTRARVLAALRERIDSAFLPRPLIIVDALPRNATGKLEREGLLAFARKALARRERAV